MTTEDLGVWAPDACALVLIDYQENECSEVIRSKTDAVVCGRFKCRLWPRPPRRSTCRWSCRRWGRLRFDGPSGPNDLNESTLSSDRPIFDEEVRGSRLR